MYMHANQTAGIVFAIFEFSLAPEGTRHMALIKVKFGKEEGACDLLFHAKLPGTWCC